jgi:hypothetical protein
MRLWLSTLLCFSWLLSSCAIPRHAAVFAIKPVKGGGLVDHSVDYSGAYVRVTNRESELGLRGGSPDHRHSIAHQHEGVIRDAAPVFSPRGTESQAAAADHSHAYFSQNQQPTFTDATPNEFTHIQVGLLVKQKAAISVPEGIVVGYLGSLLPKDWALLDGGQGRPNFDGFLLRIGPPSEWGKVFRASAHTHDATHTHDVVIREADRVQLFVPEETGRFPALPRHGHLVTSLTTESLVVGAAAPEIPQLRLAFLISVRNGARLPKGAVILMTDKTVPPGWTRVADLIRPDFVAPNSEGLFLAGQSRLGSPSVVDAKTEHDHPMSHSHTAQVGIAVGISPSKAFDGGMGNPIATENHTHQLKMSSNSPTGAASHLPPFVQFHLIVKN